MRTGSTIRVQPGSHRAVEERHSVDEKRVFATGISNGGMMSYRLACELSALIAAIGPVAGAQNLECRPAQPVSVVILHGTADLHVLYKGGAPLRMADVRNPRVDRPVSEAVAFWVKQSRCGESPVKEKKGKVARRKIRGLRRRDGGYPLHPTGRRTHMARRHEVGLLGR